jgi:hypothetical protein
VKYIFPILICLIVSCKRNPDTDIEFTGIKYSFFVAGHVYGNPAGTESGIYHLFKEKYDYINGDSSIKLGIFTGDIVKNGTSEEWDNVDKDVAGLTMPVYFAMGNHDNKNRELYIERYGKTYFDFACENDLFIVLDPNIEGWNISGAQLNYLKQLLLDIGPYTKNVFVFFHQLLWWKADNKYKNVKPNSFEGRADSINFWSNVEPLFNNLACNVVMFAGDVGAASWSADYMYDKYDNITLVASGMGEGIGDNFIIVDIMSDNAVKYRLISLNCEDINCLGNLEEYILP